MGRTKLKIWIWSLPLAATGFAAPLARADLMDDDDDAKKPAVAGSGSASEASLGVGLGSGSAGSSGAGITPVKEGKQGKPGKIGKGAKGGTKGNASLPKDNSETPPRKAPQTVLLPKGGGKKKDPKAKSDADQPVQFESKGLKGLREKGFVELVDDVVVTQGSMRLEAKHATVSYDEATREVVKVVAEGSVKMFKTDEDSGEKIKAFGDTMIFMNRERTTTLDGNARLWRGSELVKGSKLIYDMKSGLIQGEHIAGEIHPQEMGSDGKPKAKPANQDTGSDGSASGSASDNASDDGSPGGGASGAAP